jgi:hypothetical protein
MGRLRVMTWNVENLFLPGHDAGPDTKEAFARKLASLAAVIDQVATDVAALQEVGPDDALARLQPDSPTSCRTLPPATPTIEGSGWRCCRPARWLGSAGFGRSPTAYGRGGAGQRRGVRRPGHPRGG